MAESADIAGLTTGTTRGTVRRELIMGVLRGAAVALLMIGPLAEGCVPRFPDQEDVSQVVSVLAFAMSWGACCGAAAALWGGRSLWRSAGVWTAGTGVVLAAFTLAPEVPNSIRFTLEVAIWPWLVGLEAVAWGIGAAILDAALCGVAAASREPWMRARLVRATLTGASVGAVYAIGMSIFVIISEPSTVMSLGAEVFEIGCIKILRVLVLTSGGGGALAGAICALAWRTSWANPWPVAILVWSGPLVYGSFLKPFDCACYPNRTWEIIDLGLYGGLSRSSCGPERAAFVGLALGLAFMLGSCLNRFFAVTAENTASRRSTSSAEYRVWVGLAGITAITVAVIGHRAATLPIELVQSGQAKIIVPQPLHTQAFEGFTADSSHVWVCAIESSGCAPDAAAFALTGEGAAPSGVAGTPLSRGRYAADSYDRHLIDLQCNHFLSVPQIHSFNSRKLPAPSTGEIRDLQSGERKASVRFTYPHYFGIMLRGDHVLTGPNTVVNWRTGRQARLRGEISECELSPDGLSAAGVVENRLTIWDTETGAILWMVNEGPEVQTLLEFSAAYIALTTKADNIMLLDRRTKMQRIIPKGWCTMPRTDTHVSPDGKWFCVRAYAATEIYRTGSEKCEAHIYRVQSGAWIVLGDGVFNASEQARTGDLAITYRDLGLPINPHDSPLLDPNFFRPTAMHTGQSVR